ncbi:MAG TPA: acyl-CoA dehydrogenase family protein [Candidatus Hydrogenedentes bacterium]|nr:acyl-CoA dehydrogenase family protein [Candidatus Hydrogenedentota bacterium]HPG66735.1 acyl-CoA dehydrogenase family protein [Candidatus Hydrogenedentota bacterium]
MANFFDDNEDLQFYVDRAIDWTPLVDLTEYHHKAPDAFATAQEAVEFYRSVLDLVGQFSAEEVAPLAAEIDRNHPQLDGGNVVFPEVQQAIYDQVKGLEIHGMSLPRELGGMNCPYILVLLCTELFARGDVSVASHIGFHGGMALAAMAYSVYEGSTDFDTEAFRVRDTRFREMVSEIARGEAWGSMDITESVAGSDMAALAARGEQDAEGKWFVTGNKIFITSGHAKYHFVIARTEETKKDDAFAGLKGLSLFLVKAYEDTDAGERIRYAWFDKLEEKLGHHGSATVAVRYDRTPAELIGARGDGFRQMLILMNNARLGVGFESLGLCETAYRLARAYAAERPSMGKNIDRHEMIADYLDEMRTDIQALRALAVTGAWHEEIGQKLRLMLRFLPPDGEIDQRAAEAEMNRHFNASRRLTPLVKYLGAEKAVEMARRCIQIHGGYGYSTEYGAEKLLRDAMVLPIYEGTSQIQALMAMKDDLLGVLKKPWAFVQGGLRACAHGWLAADRLGRRVARLQRRRYAVLRFLLTRLAWTKFRSGPSHFLGEWDPKRDFALAMLHAERLIRLLTDVAVSEILLEQAQRYPERTEVLERYLDRAEPRCRALHYEITHSGKRLLAQLAAEEKPAS